MLDKFLSSIEAVRADGAVVVLKWDGQRPATPYTVVVTKSEVDYVWRQDSDDLVHTLQLALTDRITMHSVDN